MEKIIKRNTVQSQIILETVQKMHSHVTAEEVFMQIQNSHPNISRATVYRNLNLLVNEGEAIRISCGDSSERFDGNTSNHYHFMCTKCHRVSDLFNIESLDHINALAANNFNGVIEGHVAYFYGICEECKSKIKYEEE